MGWDALANWGKDAVRTERPSGGVASYRIDGQIAVARLGSRSDEDLVWDTDLQGHLDRPGADPAD